MERYEVRLSGSGGQGLILAGIVLAAAATAEGKHVVQTQSYGPEARGGASRAEVIISTELIDYPKVTEPHIFLALTGEAYNKYYYYINPRGFIITDQQIPIKLSRVQVLQFPIIKTAQQELGNEIVANILSLGILIGLKPIVSKNAIENSLRERIPVDMLDLNIEAFNKGLLMGGKNKKRP